MPEPVWKFQCPSCGRPFAIRSKPEQPLPADALGDIDLYDLNAGSGECSACGLKVIFEVASLELRFTNHFELKVPKLDQLLEESGE